VTSFASIGRICPTLDLNQEHRNLEWQGTPHMTLGDDGMCRLPEPQRHLIPLMYSLRAVKKW